MHLAGASARSQALSIRLKAETAGAKSDLFRIQHQRTTGACMEASPRVGAHPTAVPQCLGSDARVWSTGGLGLEKVALNPRTPSARVSGFFRRHGTVSCPGCWDPGSNHGLASFPRGDQGRTHPLLSLERCIGGARSHGSSAGTAVLVL